MKRTKPRSQHIFLGYSHKDSWEMRAIYNELRLAGFRVWIDDQLTPGTPNWQQAIANMLDAAACVVCICSPNAANSKWVNIELELANQRELKIYPVLVCGTQKDAIPTPLSIVQFTDCRVEYAASSTKLIEELMKHHERALVFDMRSIFGAQGIRWTHFGSLFWFASEVRKLRLFLLPEHPKIERVRDSLAQLLHHAKRLNVDKFTLRDIQDVIKRLPHSDLALMSRQDREYLENKLRLAQDKVAGLAEKADLSFTDGPRPGKPIVLTEQLGEDESVSVKDLQNGSKSQTNSVISILFLASDPSDASRLRLGEEMREIQEKLQLAKLRERFRLEQRMSVRPTDVSQALLDVQPTIVHFSGHGNAAGALCFENQTGASHTIQPDALAALFEQFTNQVSCVLLNACYSEKQAWAIAQHINYVIGMNKAIGDKAAIAFAIGFYQALGAGRTIDEAYKLGCVQIRLHNIPEHLTPILVKKG